MIYIYISAPLVVFWRQCLSDRFDRLVRSLYTYEWNEFVISFLTLKLNLARRPTSVGGRGRKQIYLEMISCSANTCSLATAQIQDILTKMDGQPMFKANVLISKNAAF